MIYFASQHWRLIPENNFSPLSLSSPRFLRHWWPKSQILYVWVQVRAHACVSKKRASDVKETFSFEVVSPFGLEIHHIGQVSWPENSVILCLHPISSLGLQNTLQPSFLYKCWNRNSCITLGRQVCYQLHDPHSSVVSSWWTSRCLGSELGKVIVTEEQHQAENAHVSKYQWELLDSWQEISEDISRKFI